MNDTLPFCPWCRVSCEVRSVKWATQSSLYCFFNGASFPRLQCATSEHSSSGPSCLTDVDPHAGHGWEHLVVLFLCLGFWSLVCGLQPTLQPLLDHAEAHAGSSVLLSLCPYNLHSSSAQVCMSFVFSRE